MAKRKTGTSKNAAQTLTPDQSGILASIVAAWRDEMQAERDHVAAFAATTIRLLADGVAAGIQRQTLATSLQTTSGGLSRHILLAKNADTPLTIDGRDYPGTVAALQSGTTTVRALYDVLAPSKASKTNGGQPKKSLAEAVAAICSRKVKYRDNRKTFTLSMLESRADWLKSLSVLLAHSIGGLTPLDVETIVEMIPETAPAAVATEQAKAA